MVRPGESLRTCRCMPQAWWKAGRTGTTAEDCSIWLAWWGGCIATRDIGLVAFGLNARFDRRRWKVES